MNFEVSHDRKEESLRAKARWFQTLSVDERAYILYQFTDMILEVNPKIIDRKNAQPIKGRFQVITRA